jgi:hypothetical protein
MSDFESDSESNRSEGALQLASSLQTLLERSDELGLPLVSIHIENALNACSQQDEP